MISKFNRISRQQLLEPYRYKNLFVSTIINKITLQLNNIFQELIQTRHVAQLKKIKSLFQSINLSYQVNSTVYDYDPYLSKEEIKQFNFAIQLKEFVVTFGLILRFSQHFLKSDQQRQIQHVLQLLEPLLQDLEKQLQSYKNVQTEINNISQELNKIDPKQVNLAIIKQVLNLFPREKYKVQSLISNYHQLSIYVYLIDSVETSNDVKNLVNQNIWKNNFLFYFNQAEYDEMREYLDELENQNEMQSYIYDFIQDKFQVENFIRYLIEKKNKFRTYKLQITRLIDEQQQSIKLIQNLKKEDAISNEQDMLLFYQKAEQIFLQQGSEIVNEIELTLQKLAQIKSGIVEQWNIVKVESKTKEKLLDFNNMTETQILRWVETINLPETTNTRYLYEFLNDLIEVKKQLENSIQQEKTQKALVQQLASRKNKFYGLISEEKVQDQISLLQNLIATSVLNYDMLQIFSDDPRIEQLKQELINQLDRIDNNQPIIQQMREQRNNIRLMLRNTPPEAIEEESQESQQNPDVTLTKDLGFSQETMEPEITEIPKQEFSLSHQQEGTFETVQEQQAQTFQTAQEQQDQTFQTVQGKQQNLTFETVNPPQDTQYMTVEQSTFTQNEPQQSKESKFEITKYVTAQQESEVRFEQSIIIHQDAVQYVNVSTILDTAILREVNQSEQVFQQLDTLQKQVEQDMLDIEEGKKQDDEIINTTQENIQADIELIKDIKEVAQKQNVYDVDSDFYLDQTYISEIEEYQKNVNKNALITNQIRKNIDSYFNSIQKMTQEKFAYIAYSLSYKGKTTEKYFDERQANSARLLLYDIYQNEQAMGYLLDQAQITNAERTSLQNRVYQVDYNRGSGVKRFIESIFTRLTQSYDSILRNKQIDKAVVIFQGLTPMATFMHKLINKISTLPHTKDLFMPIFTKYQQSLNNFVIAFKVAYGLTNAQIDNFAYYQISNHIPPEYYQDKVTIQISSNELNLMNQFLKDLRIPWEVDRIARYQTILSEFYDLQLMPVKQASRFDFFNENPVVHLDMILYKLLIQISYYYIMKGQQISQRTPEQDNLLNQYYTIYLFSQCMCGNVVQYQEIQQTKVINITYKQYVILKGVFGNTLIMQFFEFIRDLVDTYLKASLKEKKQRLYVLQKFLLSMDIEGLYYVLLTRNLSIIFDQVLLRIEGTDDEILKVHDYLSLQVVKFYYGQIEQLTKAFSNNIRYPNTKGRGTIFNKGEQIDFNKLMNAIDEENIEYYMNLYNNEYTLA